MAQSHSSDESSLSVRSINYTMRYTTRQATVDATLIPVDLDRVLLGTLNL